MSNVPERIWIQKSGLSFFHTRHNGTYYRDPDADSIEYARVHSPTGKVGEGEDGVDKILQWLTETPAGERIRMKCGAADLRSVITDVLDSTLATVRKEEREAAKRVVTDTLPSINFGNGEYLRCEILKALESAAKPSGAREDDPNPDQ